MESTSDEFSICEPTEKELTLYQLSAIVGSILEQLTWLKIIIEQEIERKEDES